MPHVSTHSKPSSYAIRFCLTVVVLYFLVHKSSARFPPVPLQIQWSEQSHGPDGPWHAVKVGLGQPPQLVDLFLGSSAGTHVLIPGACKDWTQKNACSGGTYDNSASHSRLDPPTPSPYSWPGGRAGYLSINGTRPKSFADHMTFYISNGPQAYTIPNTSFDGFAHTTRSYVGFDGSPYPTYPLTAGFLSIGYRTAAIRSNSSLFYPYEYLHNEGTISTASLCFTYGSVKLDISPSFSVGGYDRNRVIGPVLVGSTASSSIAKVIITRLYLGTEEGDPIFPRAPPNLLKFEANNIPIPVDIVPGNPLIHLPKETCSQLASQLPIKHDETLGFWLWDTTDPAYERIMKSSSYLAFEIRPYLYHFEHQNSYSSGSIIIKVPFQLLNLTLESPITSNPKTYFPCICAPPEHASWTLGRAFFQAAYVGYKWGTHDGFRGGYNYDNNYIFLAQAAGPNRPKEPFVVPILHDHETIGQSNLTWSETWAPYWKDISVLPSSNSGSFNSGSSDSGLAIGIKVAIGAGASVGIALICLVAFFLVRRRYRQERARTQQVTKKLEFSASSIRQIHCESKQELDSTGQPTELPSNTGDVYGEMPASQQSPRELGDNLKSPVRKPGYTFYFSLRK